MNNKKIHKPFLATNKEYLRKVAGSIKRRGKLEDIPFELINETIILLGFKDNPYKFLSPESLQIEAVQPIVDKTFQAIAKGVSNNVLEKLYCLWDYLCEADPLEKSDIIFVFGGGGETRPKEAAKLYKMGWAPKILFTGQKPSYVKNIQMTEAESFAAIAEEAGVKKKDIILEKEAINTVENATKSITLLKKSGKLPNKIILIQIEYQMRRAYLTFKAASDWNPKLIKYPAPSVKFTRENYFTTKEGWSYVFFEFIKLYGARLMGHF